MIKLFSGTNSYRRWVLALVLLLAGLGGLRWSGILSSESAQNNGGKSGRESKEGRPVPAVVAPVEKRDFQVVQSGLGTVTALNTVTIKPRVDGLLQKIHFQEGTLVKEGDVLAELDARPFQIALDQAKGQWMRDQAQLSNARMDLSRFQGLQDKEAVSRQQVDTQAALVQQLEGVVKLDQAQVDNALLQLDFSRIKAPVTGRLGIRQVDLGNMIKTADATGLVVLTQTRPISILFSLPSDVVPDVISHWLAAEQLGKRRRGSSESSGLKVEAWSRDNRQLLATGQLQTVDNQMDSSTGTVRLKARFENADERLFPNQFVNVRLFVDTLKQSTLVPEAALQRGTQGTFVYLAKPEELAKGEGRSEGEGKPEGPPMAQVKMQLIKVGAIREGWAVVEEGLQPGDRVVVDGLDKLRDGGKIILAPGTGPKKGEQAGERKGKKPAGAPAGKASEGQSH